VELLIDHPNLRVRRCRHGVMAYLPNDRYIGRSLDLYGEFSQDEVDLYRRIIKRGDVVVEVGANIGALTVPLARLVATDEEGGPGTIIAFEPQRILYQLLNTNLALNRLRNVRAEQVAIGQKTGMLGVPVIDYDKPGNFGGYNMIDVSPEMVRVLTIDSLQLRRLDFLKIDVEGMEIKVLMGAEQTIAQCQPVIYCENDRKDKSARLIACLTAMGYTMYWHLPPLYNKNNFGKRRENVFGPIISANMLCLPSDTKVNIRGMHKVTGPLDWPHASWEKPKSHDS
jgi:FkbM family methyltransferase